MVDLWGGHADPSRRREWQRDTLANVFSSTKGVLAIAAHRLVDEGRLDLDAPVARYWPEFGVAGKETLPVGMLLNHRAGVVGVRAPLPRDAPYDWEGMTTRLAREEPWWTPGTKHGYHAFSFGWLVGEVVRRVTRLSPGAYIREALSEPLGLDLHVGLRPADDARAAVLTPLPAGGPDSDQAQLLAQVLLDPASASAAAFANPPTLLAPTEYNSRTWRAAEIPAANAQSTARALARLYGCLAVGGKLDGYRLLEPAGIERCWREESQGADEVLRIPTRFSSGFMLSQSHASFGPGQKTFGHPGAGGSLGFADPENEIGFGYVTSRCGPDVILDPRPAALIDALYAGL